MIHQWWMYDVLRKENSNLLLKNSNIIINFILTIHTRLLRSKHGVKVRMNKRPTAHRTGERWLGNVRALECRQRRRHHYSTGKVLILHEFVSSEFKNSGTIV